MRLWHPRGSFDLATPVGERHTLASSAGPNGLLIAFICNHCPYVVAVAERLARDAKTLQGEGIGVVAIMSNDNQNYAADSPENMKRFAEKYGFDLPILLTKRRRLAAPMVPCARLTSLATTLILNFNTAAGWTIVARAPRPNR